MKERQWNNEAGSKNCRQIEKKEDTNLQIDIYDSRQGKGKQPLIRRQTCKITST